MVDPSDRDGAGVPARRDPRGDALPGLLLGVLHVIIADGDVDREFIDRFTSGYDESVSLVARFSPQSTADIYGNRGRRHPGDRILVRPAHAAVVYGRTYVHQRYGTLTNAPKTSSTWPRQR